MSKYLFYPGCSLQRTARSYLDSTMAVASKLNMEAEEIHDWNCCGATEYHSIHHIAAHALVGRNLALAEQQRNGADTVMVACSACYLNLAKTDSYMQSDPQLNEKVNEALAAGGMHYTPGAVKVRHLLDIIWNDAGTEAIASKVVRPLKGLKIAPYYGCMIARPDRDNRWDKPEHPVALDEVMKATGADVVDFPLKTHCCGGHMTQINMSVAYELIRRLIYGAAQYEADIIVTLCPMCQLNLDAYQAEVNRAFNTDYHIPILYFTQLMGLAFGFDAKELGIGSEFVNASKALSRIGIEVPVPEEELAEGAPAKRARRRGGKKKEEGLPIPRMPENGKGGK